MFFGKKNQCMKAFLSGKAIPIAEVPDAVFSQNMMGDGMAIIPDNDVLIAPEDADVSLVMKDSGHAVGLVLKNGMELLLHVGLDTVTMKGEGFHVLIKEGDKVSAGDPLIEFDKKLIEEKGFSPITMLVVPNHSEFPKLKFITGMECTPNETVIANY